MEAKYNTIDGYVAKKLLSSIEDATNSVQNSLIQVSIVSRESTR